MEDNVGRQIACSILWFRDWNSEERNSFGQIILEIEQNTWNLGALLNTMDNLTLNSGQMCQPTDEDGPNLFDCQIKIFTKWYKSWSPSERSEFASQLNRIDPNLISSINSELQCQVRTH